MPLSSIAVADKLLECAGEAGLDPMQLLKLDYLCQGWMLGLYGEPLIWNDVEAWRYGPVFRNVYGLVAGKPIVVGSLSSWFKKPPETFDPRQLQLISQVYQKYRTWSGLQLSALTHAPGSPWDITYRTYGQNAVIPKELIRDFYEKQAQAA
jgi:uncharacterized phage-associated protein